MEKLLAIANLGQRVYGRWLFQRLLLTIIVTTVLIIVTAITASAVLIGGLYAAFSALAAHGVDQQAGMIIVVALGMLVVVTLALLTLLSFQHIRRMPRAMLKRSPLIAHTMVAFDAFIDGLMESK